MVITRVHCRHFRAFGFKYFTVEVPGPRGGAPIVKNFWETEPPLLILGTVLLQIRLLCELIVGILIS